jgi:hypothetical protein
MGFMELAMEEVDYNLALAQSYLESYVDRSVADSFFEADDENDKAGEGARSALQKVFAKLKEIVQKILDAIKNFFDYAFLTKEEKQRYNELKAALKQDKELANTKITVEDFKVYEKLFDESLKELENEAKKDNFDEDKANKVLEKLEIALKKTGEKAAQAGKRAAMSVGLTAAVDLADNCEIAAKGMKFALDNEIATLDSLEKELGGQRVKKAKKNIDSAAKNSIFHRAKVKILRKKCNTLSDLAKKEKKKILSFTNLDEHGHLKAGKKLPVTPGSVNAGASKFSNRQIVKDTLDMEKPGGNVEYAKKFVEIQSKAHKNKKRAAHNKKAWSDAKKFFTGKD